MQRLHSQHRVPWSAPYRAVLGGYFLLFLASLTNLAAAQPKGTPPDREKLAHCSLEKQPLTPYGFAMATLQALSYARDAEEHASEVEQARSKNEPFSLVTAMMRTAKESSNDFICAKQAMRPYVGGDAGANVKIIATFVTAVYDAHVKLNDQFLQILKTLGTQDQPVLADQISSIQVERGQRNADLVTPTATALMLLVDTDHPDENGHTTRLLITREQKNALLGFLTAHFPELSSTATSKHEPTDPAKTAGLFTSFLADHLASDE